MPSSKSKKNNSSSKIILNVGGYRHETYQSTLQNIPDSRLCNLSERHRTMNKAGEFDSKGNEYFFDRHPGVFAHILNYYRTGKLHCPNDVCGPLFEEELEYWGIDEQQVETCCWELYKQHKEKQEKLKCFKLPGFDEEEEEIVFLSQDSGLYEAEDVVSWWCRVQPKVWKTMEEPHSSLQAKVIGIISFLIFAIYILKFSLSTMPFFQEPESRAKLALSILHIICLAWFTLDFMLRAVFTPSKLKFFKSAGTWTDFFSLVPLYVLLFFPDTLSLQYMEMMVMLKAVRIFQLFKLSYVLQVLVNTLTASLRELAMLLIIMAFQIAVFSSVLYFIERREPKTDFSSVPHSMWYTIITMTTVGYGDVSPQTWMGKIVGSACAICGVLVIALPVSVVASNFSIFYTYAKARLNLPIKTRRVALSHALTSMQIPRTSRPAGYPSINHTSFSSMERRNTQRTLNASETSVNFASSLPGTPISRRSPSNSYGSLSLVDTPKSTGDSKSGNALFPEFGASAFQYPLIQDDNELSVGLVPPRRASSTSNLSRKESYQDVFLTVPQKGERLQASNYSLHITSTYPLYLRRGAVTPASMSLKSNSTNSSIHHLFNDGLNFRRPILFLSRNSLSMQSLKSMDPNLACSCTSIKSKVHIHSADDATPLTPVVCDMIPYVLNNPSISICSSMQNLAPPRADSPASTSGPAIAVIPPPEESPEVKLEYCGSKLDVGHETGPTGNTGCTGTSNAAHQACDQRGIKIGNVADHVTNWVISSNNSLAGNYGSTNSTRGEDYGIVNYRDGMHSGKSTAGHAVKPIVKCSVSREGNSGRTDSNLSLVSNPLNELTVPVVGSARRRTYERVSTDDLYINQLRRSTTL